MGKELTPLFPFFLFCRDKKALPLFDVCFLKTHTQTKGRAMSGSAAKITFDRDNVQHFGWIE